MGPAMPTVAVISRALGLAAGILLGASRSAQALIVVDSSVSPGTVVPLGTVITLTMTLTAETPYNQGLGNLEADPLIQARGCQYPPVLDGWITVFADDPMLVTTGVPSATSVDFLQGFYAPVPDITHWVQWSFTATRTGTVSFSVVAADIYGHNYGPAVYEGCADPSPLLCGFPGLETPFSASTCSFATVKITSTLTGRLSARSSGAGGARPAGQAYVGDPIELVMSVTNTGSDALTINAAVASTENTDTDVVLVPVSAPAFPVPLAGGGSAMLTWTYSTSANGLPGQVSFWADAESRLAFSDPLAVVAAPIALTVSMWVDPDGAGALPSKPLGPDGSSFPMANDEAWIVATLQNTSAGAIDVDPRIVPQSNDFLQVGSRIPAVTPPLGAFTSRSFTWKYVVDRERSYQACLPFSPGFPAPMMWSVDVRGVAQSTSLPMGTVIFSVTPDIPPVAVIGSEFSATLWVTNLAGRAVVLDASATVYLQSAGGAPPVTVFGIPPAGSRTFTAAGESIPFVFTCSASGTGTQNWDGGIAFAELTYPGYYACLGMTSAVATEVVAPSPLVATLSSSTTVVNAQTPYGLTLSLFNSATCQTTLTGVEDIYGLNERPIPASFLSARESTDCPTLPCNIPAGSTYTFTWSVTPNGCGDEDWSGTMTGDWDPVCLSPTAFSRPYHSNRVLVRQRASLFDPGSMAWVLPQTSVVETGDFEVVCSVVPGGQNDIDFFQLTIQPHMTSTASSISLVTAPTIPAVLPGCGACVNNVCWDKAQSFTWTFKANTKGDILGKVWFTFTASGVDVYDGSPVESMTTTGTVKILRPSVISVSALNDPTVTCQRTTEMDVSVVGDTPVIITSVGITPSATSCLFDTPVSVCCSSTLYSGVQAFNWTYTPLNVGCVSFTVSAVGVETGLGRVVYDVATTADPRCFTAPVLGGWLRSLPESPLAGSVELVRVWMTVTNGGDVAVEDLAIQDWSVAGTTECGGQAARVPQLTASVYSSTSTLFACDRPTYNWWFTTAAGGEGVLMFAVTVTGKRADTDDPMKLSDRFCVRIWPTVVVTITSAPEYVVQGRDFDVGLTVSNQSSVAMKVTPVFPVMTSTSGNLVEMSPGPGVVSVAPFTSQALTARMTVRAAAPPGADLLTIPANAFTALDMSGKSPVAVPVILGAGVDLTVLPNQMVFEIGENPWHPLRGALSVRYVAPDGGALTLKAYTLAGELVRTIIDERSAGLQGTVLWDGRNEDGQPVAAGIYFLRFEGSGLKVTKKLAVVK